MSASHLLSVADNGDALRHLARLLRGTLADGGRWLNVAIAWKIHMRDLLLLAAVELVLVATAVVVVIATL